MNRSRTPARRWQIAGVGAVAVALVGVGLGVASADENTAAPTVNCATVGGSLGAVPQQAKAEIERNLALLNTQMQEANRRLATSRNEGGPNFISNAILVPLKGKRESTINRMATAIGRSAAKPVLNVDALATCQLNTSGKASKPESTEVSVSNGNTGNGNAGNGNAGATLTVKCPEVTGLPAIPQQAQAEVASNLALLDKQIEEANRRLATSANEGGPNFIENAILRPLEGKREAALNRIETAIGRNAEKPEGLEKFARCELNQ